MKTFREHLVSMGACKESVEWVGSRTPREAWEECEEPEWLFWYLHRVGVDWRLLTRAACACARLALVYIPAGEERPRIAIETAERWTRGEATDEELRVSRCNAYSFTAPAAPYYASHSAASSAHYASHSASSVYYARQAGVSKQALCDAIRSVIRLEEVLQRRPTCAESCRALDMRLAYVEIEPYSWTMPSCTCAAKEE